MTEAEIIEQINKKRQELEETRAGNASTAVLKSLEDEIENLEASLSKENTNPREQQVFLDECAG